MFGINIPSAGLNLVALMLLNSMMWNDFTTMEAIGVSGLALMVWILDEIRYPAPVLERFDDDMDEEVVK